MEGVLTTDFVTAALVVVGFVITVILAIYAIRRARKARQRQIDEVGEERVPLAAKPQFLPPFLFSSTHSRAKDPS